MEGLREGESQGKTGGDCPGSAGCEVGGEGENENECEAEQNWK